MATYKLTQTFSDNTTKDINFTIPETAGTYKLKFTLSDSTVIDAGNVVVGTAPSTYKINLAMADGSNVSANFLVPSIGYKVTIPARESGISALQYRYTNTSGGTSFVNASASSTTTVMVQLNTSIQVYAHTLSDTANYQAWTGNTTTWTVTSDDMFLPKFHAQYKYAPTITGTSATSNSVTCTIKNNCTISAAIMLLKSTSPTGQYSPAITRPFQINGSASIQITATDLSLSTTYYWMAILIDMNGNIQSSPESAVVTQATSAPASVSVEIPAKQPGVSTLTYRYKNSSGTWTTVNAGTSAKTVAVKTNTFMSITASTFTHSDYQAWTDNTTSWNITSSVSLPPYYAQIKGSPVYTSVSTYPQMLDVRYKNNLSQTYNIYAECYTAGMGTFKDSDTIKVTAGSTGSFLLGGNLTSGTGYDCRAQYRSVTAGIKPSAFSTAERLYTDQDPTTT